MTPQSATEFRHSDDQTIGVVPSASGLIAVTAPTAVPSERVAPVPAGADRQPAEGAPGAGGWRTVLRDQMLAIADLASATFALAVVLPIFGDAGAWLAFAGVPLVLALFKAAGLYDCDELRLVPSTLDEAPLLLQLTGLFALGIAILEPLILRGSIAGERLGALWIVSFTAITSGRVLARLVVRRVSPAERCLVIGELDQVDRISDRLAGSNARAMVIACLPLTEDFSAPSGGETDLSNPEVIRRLVQELGADRIIIAPRAADTHGLVELIRTAKAAAVKVSVLPRIIDVAGFAFEFDNIDGMTMLGIRRFGLSSSSRLLKRAFDVALTSVGLILISPLIGAIALAIKLDSKGPVLFRQVRVGRAGRHFRMIKFRSMVQDAEARKDELRSLNEAGEGLFKISDDPRVTRVGRFLRRSSLDELPQLFNVIMGDMSLVGPRPLVTDEDAQVLGLDRSRLHLAPGITGPWQVLGSRTPMQEMVGLDYLYVATWTLWLDLKILLRTVQYVLRRGNL